MRCSLMARGMARRLVCQSVKSDGCGWSLRPFWHITFPGSGRLLELQRRALTHIHSQWQNCLNYTL